MRILFTISLPVEAANNAARNGFSAVQSILEEQKPEAVYFGTKDGKRTAFLIMQMEREADIPRILEPWFLSMNASVDVMPVMNAEDLASAGPSIRAAVEKYG